MPILPSVTLERISQYPVCKLSRLSGKLPESFWIAESFWTGWKVSRQYLHFGTYGAKPTYALLPESFCVCESLSLRKFWFFCVSAHHFEAKSNWAILHEMYRTGITWNVYFEGDFDCNMWRSFLPFDFVDRVCMKYMEIFLRGSFQRIFHAIEFQRDDLFKAEWLMMFLICFFAGTTCVP